VTFRYFVGSLARQTLRLGGHLCGDSISEPSASNRDYEQTRIGQQDFAVGLRGIGVAQPVTVAGEEVATLVVGEKLQERLQRGTRKPVGRTLLLPQFGAGVYMVWHPMVASPTSACRPEHHGPVSERVAFASSKCRGGRVGKLRFLSLKPGWKRQAFTTPCTGEAALSFETRDDRRARKEND
jgi:hypothetical protein